MQSTLDQHLGQQSFQSSVIFAETSLMDTYDLVNTCLTIDQLWWSDVDWDIDQVLMELVES